VFPLSELPPDILRLTSEFLTTREILNLSLASRKFSPADIAYLDRPIPLTSTTWVPNNNDAHNGNNDASHDNDNPHGNDATEAATKFHFSDAFQDDWGYTAELPTFPTHICNRQVHSVLLSFEWQDQGWSYQKGGVRVIACQGPVPPYSSSSSSSSGCSVVNTDRGDDGIMELAIAAESAPRRREHKTLSFMPKPGCFHYLQLRVGEGGLHSLFVGNFQLRYILWDDRDRILTRTFQKAKVPLRCNTNHYNHATTAFTTTAARRFVEDISPLYMDAKPVCSKIQTGQGPEFGAMPTSTSEDTVAEPARVEQTLVSLRALEEIVQTGLLENPLEPARVEQTLVSLRTLEEIVQTGLLEKPVPSNIVWTNKLGGVLATTRDRGRNPFLGIGTLGGLWKGCDFQFLEFRG